MFLFVNSPKSSGRVSLRGKSPFQKPVIEPNYFTHREDINVLIEGIRIACNISDQPAMKRFGSRLHRIPFPGCRHLPFDSDEYWECSIRQVRLCNILISRWIASISIIHSSHSQSTIQRVHAKWAQATTMVLLLILDCVSME